MGHRLQCDLCGAKSIMVDNPRAVSAKELQDLKEFRAEHETCIKADERHLFADGAVSLEVPVVHCGPFGSEKPPVESVPRPHGHFEYTGPYGEIQSGETLSCCHCGAHWEVRAGSGKTRGFCALCFNGDHGSGYTCGKKRCDVHVPRERQLENIEAGRPLLTPCDPLVVVPETVEDLVK